MAAILSRPQCVNIAACKNTRTNADFSLLRLCVIHLRVNSQSDIQTIILYQQFEIYSLHGQ